MPLYRSTGAVKDNSESLIENKFSEDCDVSIVGVSGKRLASN